MWEPCHNLWFTGVCLLTGGGGGGGVGCTPWCLVPGPFPGLWFQVMSLVPTGGRRKFWENIKEVWPFDHVRDHLLGNYQGILS